MRVMLVGTVACCLLTGACKFPYPEDVPDDDVADSGADAPLTTRRIGGAVSGLWAGGGVTLHLQADGTSEDVAAGALDPFVFASGVEDGTSYLVTVADDGPDHDCVVTNGSGRVMGADVTDLAVECTSLVPHSISISTSVPFVFDPRVTRYVLPVSVLQQEVRVTVTGPTLTSATVADQAVVSGVASAPLPLGQGATTIAIELEKAPLSRRYELVFERGMAPIVEAHYARAFNAGAGDAFGAAVACTTDFVAIGAPNEDSTNESGNDNAVQDSGGVYIYRRNGQTWTYSQFLKGSAVASYRHFGRAIAMKDDLMVVGAPVFGAPVGRPGAAYVFRLDRTTGFWIEEQRLAASQVQNRDFFGQAVAANGEVIAVGASQRDLVAGSFDVIGAVHSFHRSGNLWVEEPVLRPPAGQPRSAQFGVQLALEGAALVVTQFMPDYRNYTYRRSGTTWSPENLPAAAAGPAISVDRDVLSVGQPSEAPGGAVRIFTRSGASWNESGRLQAATPQAGSEIGAGVALRNNVVVTAATPTHLLQVFDRIGGTWIPMTPIAPSGPPNDDPVSPTFGTAIALCGQGAAVGASGDGGPSNTLPGSGTVWMFR